MNKVKKTLCRDLNNCIHQLHLHMQKLPQTGELTHIKPLKSLLVDIKLAQCVANVLPKKKTKIPRISHEVCGLSEDPNTSSQS